MTKKVEDGAIRVATYSREHQVVVNSDGTIDIYRRPTTRTVDNASDRARAAFESINRRNREFWEKYGETEMKGERHGSDSIEIS